jgi:UDPglucose--hexose-1-phosphate uridylyltransferase
MNEVRENRVTGKRILYAPSRGRRPHDSRLGKEAPPSPSHRADCPFCPGNEAQLPGILLEIPGRRGAPWGARVAPNKYPALVADDAAARAARIPPLARGRHEVIVETPRHDRDLARMSRAEVETVIEVYHRRTGALRAENRFGGIFLFRNHGAAAGTSLIHPHSQIMATVAAPPEARRREARARRYFEREGRSLFADMLAFERAEGRRMVEENEHFAAFVPFAAETPCEIWILPQRQMADFAEIEWEEKRALAAILRNCLRRLHRRLGDPAYRYVLISASRAATSQPWFCWYLRIYPQLSIPAGFELASGLSVNPSLPEKDAATLRGRRG